MLKRIAVAALLFGVCSIASAQSFRLSYGNGRYTSSGVILPNYLGGYNAYGYDTRSGGFNYSYQPLYYPSYAPSYYRPAPVMNDYYRQSPYQGYGFKGW